MLNEKYGDYSIKFLDRNNYTLEKTVHGQDKEGNPKESQKLLGHYSSIESAVKAIAKMVSDNEAETLAEWITEYQKVLADFSLMGDAHVPENP